MAVLAVVQGNILTGPAAVEALLEGMEMIRVVDMVDHHGHPQIQ